MSFKTYIPAAVILPNTGGTVAMLEDIPFETGLDDLTVFAAGSILPGFTGSHRAQGMYALSTPQIKTILDYCTTDSVCRAHTSGNSDIEYQQVADLATRFSNASTEHQRHRFTRSLLCWESIDANEGSLATINFKIMPTSADDSNPITITSGVAMTSTASVGAVYSLGPVKFESDLYCVDKWSLNLGIQYETRFCSGGPHLRFAAVKTLTPVLTVTVPNQAQVLANWSTGGVGISTSVIAFLRKRSAGGINVANATEEHIAITATAGTIKPVGRNELKVQLHNFSIDTTAAIA
jgi:hypothetical protein